MTTTQQLVAFALIALVIANLFFGAKASTNRGFVTAAFTGPADPLTASTANAPAPASPSLGPSSGLAA